MPRLASSGLFSGVAVAALPGDSDDSGRQNIAPMDTEDTGGSAGNAGTANAGAAGFVTRRPRTSGKKGVVPGPPPVDYKPSGGRKGPPPPPPVPLSRVALAKSAAPPANSLPKLPDLSGVKMENQHVYQIPEEVRMEIFELRTKFKFSNAELAAAVGRSGGANPGQAVGRFLNATGESGDQKQIYTPLAHFVEKMRIYEKRPKSQKRKQLEKDAERRPGKKPLLVSDLKTISAPAGAARASAPPPPPPAGKGKGTAAASASASAGKSQSKAKKGALPPPPPPSVKGKGGLPKKTKSPPPPPSVMGGVKKGGRKAGPPPPPPASKKGGKVPKAPLLPPPPEAPPPEGKSGRKGPPPPPPVPRSRVALAKADASSSLPVLPYLSGVKMENQHVYQIPEEVRMEIFELRTKFKFSNAELAAAVGRTGGANPGQAVNRFLNATGGIGENMNIYTPLAHFVEKMRIYEKRPKSQKRKQLEKDAERRPGKKPLLVSDLKTTSGSSRGAMAPAGAGASA
ncbi:hypothetical protein PPROV_000534300 [Pycnococcus provasolii]|uniref:Uncharacterized protein n=1 Tax=Pycnococcus provasolii TaxID=41880 RepID=A0A830HIA2_9CHLO|nr:hypothetical protein PPROV_000534300 [Pycnococcus provasolii]